MKSLQAALLVLINITEKTTGALEDDGIIDWMEGTGLGISALGLIKVFKDLKNIVAEFKALTPDQKLELAEWFKEEFDITDNNVESIVEEIFSSLIQMSGLFDLLTSIEKK